MYQRFHLEPFFQHWSIKDRENADFIFGPFENESDAYFVVQMFNSGKIKFSKDGNHGKENFEEPNSVY